MKPCRLHLPGAELVADPSGALLWPERELLVVADLHFEKASGIARKGRLLPPYDTIATLARLAVLLRTHRPRTVICLGDSFHDRKAGSRLAPKEAETLRAMTEAHVWIWIAGNHDPDPPEGLGGRAASEVAIGALAFRHAPAEGFEPGEVSGHLHPKGAVRMRGRRVSRPCFATDGRRVVLPAFGAFTGGLNVLDPAFLRLLAPGFWAYLLGRDRVHVVPCDRLSPESVQYALLPA